jgi:carnitine O-acetyltransferase
MEQHKVLFSSTRIQAASGTPHERLQPAVPGPSQERHIAVLFRSNLFHVEVIEEAAAPTRGPPSQGRFAG